ncbi:hypothetical protein C1645_814560 [Glomus cerebriforme]|uniref:Uncharacterized protein n=1 Tax=Glomus cerebriforme TaxID=658196 RepID=A0A397TKM0_9GLOM|nr:hypothetical protein C1645_814560 [Glomus cerebriforme]
MYNFDKYLNKSHFIDNFFNSLIPKEDNDYCKKNNYLYSEFLDIDDTEDFILDKESYFKALIRLLAETREFWQNGICKTAETNFAKLSKMLKLPKLLPDFGLRMLSDFLDDLNVSYRTSWMNWIWNVTGLLGRTELGMLPNFLGEMDLECCQTSSDKLNSMKEFTSKKLWFSQVVTSLTRKPKMATDLTELLVTLKIIFYTFQNELPNPINKTKHDENELVSDNVFGMNDLSYEIINLFDNIIDKYLTFYFDLNGELQYMTNFDASTIHDRILEKLDHGCFGNPSHMVILKAEGISNSNKGIYQSAEMYKKDFSLNSDEYLNIVADESIF